MAVFFPIRFLELFLFRFASIKFETLSEVLAFVCSASSAWRAEQSVAPCCLVESPQGLATPLDLWIQAVCANVSIANSKICEQDSYGYAMACKFGNLGCDGIMG